jgi:hypothetical protein
VFKKRNAKAIAEKSVHSLILLPGQTKPLEDWFAAGWTLQTSVPTKIGSADMVQHTLVHPGRLASNES